MIRPSMRQPAVNNINDFKSNKTISGLSIPHRLVIGANYQVPKWDTNKFVSWALRDWTIGAMLTYAIRPAHYGSQGNQQCRRAMI